MIEPPSKTLAAPAFAKINLTLEVLGRRPDGYHEIRSLMVGVDWCDTLSAVALPQRSIELACDVPALANEDNLVYRAARLMSDRYQPQQGIRLTLTKRLPIGAGLGGGSSDAASTLRLCNRVWGLGLSDGELAACGAELGSDVPFFFCLPSALVRGRGERVEPVALRWSGWLTLAVIDAFVSTAEVYRAWRPFSEPSHDRQGVLPEPSHDRKGVLPKAVRRPRGEDGEDAERWVRACRAETALELTPLLCNDLEPAVFAVSDKVRARYNALCEAGLSGGRLTGAGSVVYFPADDRAQAERTASMIERASIDCSTHVVRVLNRGDFQRE